MAAETRSCAAAVESGSHAGQSGGVGLELSESETGDVLGDLALDSNSPVTRESRGAGGGAGGGGSSLEVIPIVPNTLVMACNTPSAEARVITEARSPFVVVFVNAAWSRLFGYSQTEVAGRPLSLVQGPATDMREVSLAS